jgi:putative membrane protein
VAAGRRKRRKAALESAGRARKEKAMMWGWGGGGWWGLGMGLGSMVFIGLVVVGIVLLVRGPSEGSEPRRRERTARDILDERYARGEIDHDEYEQRRRVLESAGSR